MAWQLRIFASHLQFYVEDEDEGRQAWEADEEYWHPGELDDLLAARGALVAVFTSTYGYVWLTFQVLAHEPGDDLTAYDDVVEGSLYAPSGQVIIYSVADDTDTSPRFTVPVGWLRIRVSRSNLATATAASHGEIPSQDDDPATHEHVLIQLWPAPQVPTVVHKRWQP